MRSLDLFARNKLDALEAASLRRHMVDTLREEAPHVLREGRRLLSFSCNDYLGLSIHPAVKAAAIAAIERHGVGAGASRLVTGNHPLNAALESRLADAKGMEAACLFGSGYLANVGTIGVVVGEGDLILLDELCHACIHAGARLAGARVIAFRHNDPAHAAALLEAERGAARHALLITETVFSMDGDRAPLDALAALCARHNAWLMTDDAHGFGVSPGMSNPAALQMGTLSKAAGGYGGYLCASSPVIDLVKTRARSLIYSTGLPPASVAAALAALDVMAADPSLAREPLRKARLFTEALGLAPAQSPIVPLVLGTPDAALQASTALVDAGFLVTAIRPPTVPPGTARLRFACSAAHADADVARLAAAVAPIASMACPASS